VVIEFTVYGKAQPAGSKRAFVNKKTGRAQVVDDNVESKPWQAEVKAAAIEAMDGENGYPDTLTGPLVLELVFVRPRLQSHYGANGLLPSAPVAPIKRPDATKLTRGVEDALTGIVWRDDSQIVEQHVSKVWGSPARCEVRVSRWSPGGNDLVDDVPGQLQIGG
jgi:Holliday junction resolvase RusA-like endonuclease